MSILFGLIFGALLLGSFALSAFFFMQNYNLSKKKPDPKYSAADEVKNWKLKLKSNRTIGITGAALAALFFVLVIFIPAGFVTINAGEVAVVKVWGEIKEYKTSGLHFRNILSDEYVKYDTKVQQLKIEKWCYVKDETDTTQVIQAVLTVQFSINESKVTNIAKEYGSLTALKDRVTTVILGALETSAAERTINSLITGTGKIDYQNEVKDLLIAHKDADGKTVEDHYYVSFRQITIEEFVLEEKLEEAMLRVRIAEASRKERNEQLLKETAEVEAKARQDEIKAQTLRDIEKANAQNNILIAELLAEAKEAEAKGEANALIERARGEAESLRLKSIELARSIGIEIKVDNVTKKEYINPDDPEIKSLAKYLQYIAYLEAWDGKLPDVVLDDSGNWIVPLP